MNPVTINSSIAIGKGKPLSLIAGPCVIESEKLVLDTAEAVAEICRSLDIPYIFKASYDKANRSNLLSFRGPGIDKGLKILARVKSQLEIPIITDIHDQHEVEAVAEVVDIVQIPAFLCRQTNLLLAAGKTGKPVNVKKGQFMAPEDMGGIIGKISSTGNNKILLTERGTTFGYHNLVVDFRAVPIMQKTGCPVIFDATHSVQLPAARGECSGGDRQMIPTLAAAAVAAGVDALFMEVHPNPDQALCDGANSLSLQQLKPLLKHLRQVWEACQL